MPTVVVAYLCAFRKENFQLRAPLLGVAQSVPVLRLFVSYCAYETEDKLINKFVQDSFHVRGQYTRKPVAH